MTKRWMTALLVLGAISLSGTRSRAVEAPTIGVAMPSTSEARWEADSAAIQRDLQAQGFQVDLRNADNDVATQIDQIRDMIARGDKALVIAPISDGVLNDVLKTAVQKNVRVIAYDRLIRNTPDVDYFVSFDNFKVGVLQAQSLLRGLGLPAQPGPFNIEIFAGSPDDANATLTYSGAMSVLDPLIRSGTLRVASGEVEMKDVRTPRWSADAAHARLDNILTAFYETRHLDGVLSPNDEVSAGLIASLTQAGYGKKQVPMAIVTGQDCELPAVRAMIAGRQYSSVFKDTRALADAVTHLVAGALGPTPSRPADAVDYDNGAKQVPTLLLQPVAVYKGDITTVLVDSKYYTPEQFK